MSEIDLGHDADYCENSLDDVLTLVGAPTYVVRVSFYAFGEAVRVSSDSRISVVAGAGLEKYEWYFERYDEGVLTSFIHSMGA